MTAESFLADFEAEDYPSEYGPWLMRAHFDPPHTMTTLRRMHAQGLIELDEGCLGGARFRLTLKAAQKARALGLLGEWR